MGKAEKKWPKNEREWEREAERIEAVLNQNATLWTPIPKELKTEAAWVKINGRNMRLFDPTGYSVEDLPLSLIHI